MSKRKHLGNRNDESGDHRDSDRLSDHDGLGCICTHIRDGTATTWVRMGEGDYLCLPCFQKFDADHENGVSDDDIMAVCSLCLEEMKRDASITVLKPMSHKDTGETKLFTIASDEN
jgi:hypothetical protein